MGWRTRNKITLVGRGLASLELLLVEGLTRRFGLGIHRTNLNQRIPEAVTRKPKVNWGKIAIISALLHAVGVQRGGEWVEGPDSSETTKCKGVTFPARQFPSCTPIATDNASRFSQKGCSESCTAVRVFLALQSAPQSNLLGWRFLSPVRPDVSSNDWKITKSTF